MCRLFGLQAGRTVVTATFWLLDAPDNLAAQSRRNPDGTGLGVFDAHGEPHVRKQPMAAWHDRAFACEAKEMTGTTFLAHIRYATTGKLDVVNTHPFLQDDRLFAHNGVVEGLDELDLRLTSVFASEQMDDNPAWRLLDAGELVHVDADLKIERRLAFPDPPRHLLQHTDLSPVAAAAQREA